MTWIIKDWMSNRLWPDKEFETFEDGWAFIYENDPNEENYEDYFVEEEE
ncbi:MAG: hypothetical protein ACO2ZP_00495 [Bacteriovoracaceae bacterium]